MNKIGDKELHKSPYHGVNNRKKTKCRIKSDMRIQSVPLYEVKEIKDIFGSVMAYCNGKQLGYRYIYH